MNGCEILHQLMGGNTPMIYRGFNHSSGGAGFLSPTEAIEPGPFIDFTLSTLFFKMEISISLLVCQRVNPFIDFQVSIFWVISYI